ncbi:MAG: FtsB family cell division protein [Limnochordia bacterium]|jgi:cell division protein DivIC|nr:septum formation initiator family protein [Bacillota bacterium]NLL08987.1 septum formation initiator family protein [Bacillota bacterium]HBG09148.1 septum formation initiator [Bacillota bacterium]
MAREVKRQRKVRINVGRVLLLVLILWVALGFGKNAWENHKLRREIEGLQRRIAVLEMRREDLEREIAECLSPENVEKIAREQLGLVKPGEILYRLSESAED